MWVAVIFVAVLVIVSLASMAYMVWRIELMVERMNVAATAWRTELGALTTRINAIQSVLTAQKDRMDRMEGVK